MNIEGKFRPIILVAMLLSPAGRAAAQVPHEWRDSLVFHTFSIVAVDPGTGEVGVAVTTRVPCVGNGVPWVRAGVGAVATQANTRTAYGAELLDALATGETPADALARLLAADSSAASRQIGVIDIEGRVAQHTGAGTLPWAGHRAGVNYAVQGNILVGPEVLDAVASSFEATASEPRHLADRLIAALAAGHERGGDQRHGLRQSAAVVVADARPGRSRRADGQTANINVCEHAEPVQELRRIYDTVSQTLGYRTLEQQRGSDVWQLRVILHALGYFAPDRPAPDPRDPDAYVYTADLIAAVDSFRTAANLPGPRVGVPSGMVDTGTVQLMWAALERTGRARAVREQLLDATAVRR